MDKILSFDCSKSIVVDKILCVPFSCDRSSMGFIFVVVVVVVAVGVHYGQGGGGGSGGMYYFIVVNILFYYDIYIILLY